MNEEMLELVCFSDEEARKVSGDDIFIEQLKKRLEFFHVKYIEYYYQTGQLLINGAEYCMKNKLYDLAACYTVVIEYLDL